MTTQEFKQAFAMAKQHCMENRPLDDLSPFDGFALREFQPVTVTLAHVAKPDSLAGRLFQRIVG